MGISERKKREREQRRKEILNAAETLFFSQGYDKVSMDAIADAAELNKATIYLYFKNKEALLSAVVLRGIRILLRKYTDCADTQVPGVTKVALMGRAYYQFTREQPDYQRLMRYYSLERFSEENPCTIEIRKAFSTCRTILMDAIQEGIDDGTIRNDLNPFLISMYLIITFMGILSLEDKWKRVIESEGFSHEEFIQDFFRFITPAVSTGDKPHKISFDQGAGGPFASLFFGMEPVIIDRNERK